MILELISRQKSIRTFRQERLDRNTLMNILDYANRLPMLVKGIAVEFKMVSNIEKIQGFRNPFSVHAPYYLCISSETEGDYLMNAGYLMQTLNLYIEGLGLGTCFLGYGSPGRALKSTMKYEYVLALAFGKTDKSLTRSANEAKRLPEEACVTYKEEVSAEIKNILTAARFAPSSYNVQPWRFVVYRNRIHIFAKKNALLNFALDKNRLIDIGIMLANFLAAAEELWIETSITKIERMMNKSFQNNEYILTLLIG